MSHPKSRLITFFRGKTQPFDDPSQYLERRKILEHIKDLDFVDVKGYSPQTFSNECLAEEYREYKV